jgi:Tol biopolymer transport system component
MKTIKKICVWLTISLLILSSLSCTAQKGAGKIIYQSVKDGNLDLFSIDVNGGTPIRLTDDPANDIAPTYISATNQIGFASNRQDYWNLYSMDMDGKNLKKVTNKVSLQVSDSPDWSIDGKFITASLSDYQTGCGATFATRCNGDIYVLNSDGTNFKNLTNLVESDWSPDWSPDGQKIIFSSDRDGDAEVYVMNKDGSSLIQLTNNSGYDGRPRWSPDGKKISFETDRDKGNWDIYIMNADGSDPEQITDNPGNDYFASWSPDGKWLVYISDKSGDNEIFIVNIDNHKSRQVTRNSFYGMKFDYSPVWIP